MQISLEELLAVTAALESHSEHPLASSVLDFAESVISPAERDADQQDLEMEASTSETSWLKGDTEMVVLVPKGPGPNKSLERSKRRTSWLRPAKDVEPKAGKLPTLFCYYGLL